MTPVKAQRLPIRQGRFKSPSFLMQIGLLACLAAGALCMPSFRTMDMLAKIMIFAVAVASFDIILGYTGIISFAHGMFFGIGAYAVALICYHSETPTITCSWRCFWPYW
jgi:branched-chain amino acid transport system permease protein